MTMEEQLKQEILKKYRSILAFTNAIGIPYTTLDSALKRGIANAGVSSMITVFSALGLNIENISKGDLFYNEKAPSDLDEAEETILLPEENELVSIYRSLNRSGKDTLLSTARGFAGNPALREEGLSPAMA